MPATDVFPLPDGLPLEESAVLGCAIFTAYGAVRHGADLRGGERIAVVAAGGVGHQHHPDRQGVRRVADHRRRHARRQARGRHAGSAPRDVVNAATTDATARVRELTDGHGVDVAFEVLGLPQTFTQAFDMIRDGGRMVAVGIAPGKTTAPVEITRLVRRELRIIGSYGARTRSDMPEIIRLAAQGIFRPETMVTQRFSLDRGRCRLSGAGAGRIVGQSYRRAVDRNQKHEDRLGKAPSAQAAATDRFVARPCLRVLMPDA